MSDELPILTESGDTLTTEDGDPLIADKVADYGANFQQIGDVLHEYSTGQGTITMKSGDLVMTAGLESALLDCWMGGNADDDGSAATEKNQWWGNEGEPEEYRSRGRLQSMFDGSPITSARLPELEEAARMDVLNQLPRNVVKDVEVSVSTTGPKRIDIVATVIQADGSRYTTRFEEIPT